jgi:hypothetical protein
MSRFGCQQDRELLNTYAEQTCQREKSESQSPKAPIRSSFRAGTCARCLHKCRL